MGELIPLNDHGPLVPRNDTTIDDGLNLPADEIVRLLHSLTESQDSINGGWMDLEGGGDHEMPHAIPGKVERLICLVPTVSQAQCIKVAKQFLPPETQQGTNQGCRSERPASGNPPQTAESGAANNSIKNCLGLVIGGMTSQNEPRTLSLCELSQASVAKPPGSFLDAVIVFPVHGFNSSDAEPNSQRSAELAHEIGVPVGIGSP